MMEPVKRVRVDSPTPLSGTIEYDLPKLTWNIGFISLALIFAPATFDTQSCSVFLVLTYTSLLVGHSVGMHRMMIHRTFKANRWVRRTLIYIGVLVGMAGPFSIIRIHDLRDWAQRKEHCHDFFSHKRSFFRDLWWQLTSKFEFTSPPQIYIEPLLKKDRFLIFCEKTWKW